MINFCRTTRSPGGRGPAGAGAAGQEARASGLHRRGNEPEDVYDVGTPGFVRWQARQAAILAMEAWEEAIDGSIDSWAADAPDPDDAGCWPTGCRGSDLNAFYDRESISFFHDKRPGKTTSRRGQHGRRRPRGGPCPARTRLRPDLWDTSLLEVGATHEAFGDAVAHVRRLLQPTGPPGCRAAGRVARTSGAQLRRGQRPEDLSRRRAARARRRHSSIEAAARARTPSTGNCPRPCR